MEDDNHEPIRYGTGNGDGNICKARGVVAIIACYYFINVLWSNMVGSIAWVLGQVMRANGIYF